MTLGLLKLAGFTSASILAGKSIGQLVTMALLLLVQAPFALLAITLGGVSPHQVVAAWVILLDLPLSVALVEISTMALSMWPMMLAWGLVGWSLWRDGAAVEADERPERREVPAT